MPKLSADRLPSYCKHKQSGQAVVYLDNREVLLGVHGTAASREKYNRLIGEWLANGRALLAAAADVVILHVIQRFWDHARKYYVRPDGTPSNEQRNFADVLRVLKKSYGRLPAAEFSPLKLKAVREEMIRLGWCRTNINRQIDRLKHVFKWSAENELVPPSVYHRLQAVARLKAGRSEARESEPCVAAIWKPRARPGHTALPGTRTSTVAISASCSWGREPADRQRVFEAGPVVLPVLTSGRRTGAAGKGASANPAASSAQ